jgi:putative phosphonate metabolism protein
LALNPSAPRYAVYFAPEDGTALARFGRWWLDPSAADDADPPWSALPLDRATLTAEPRRYGFHATLKAPFRLAADHNEAGLIDAMAAFARRIRPFSAAPPALARLDGFLALRPTDRSPALEGLAELCLRSFDAFRAPPTAAELEKRRPHALSPRQQALLAAWGYPHVLDQYRFHMTLTGRFDAATLTRVQHVLEPFAAECRREALAIRSICLFTQASPAQAFVLSRRFPLAG